MASWYLSFWERMGLKEKDRALCLEAVRRRYDEYNVEEFEYQGFCSFTLVLSPRQEHSNSKNGTEPSVLVPASGVLGQLIVQFRPVQYALNLDTAWAASKSYAALAPAICALDFCLPGGLRAYEMNRLEGTPISQLQPRCVSTPAGTQTKQETLIASFAKAIAQGWPVVTPTRRRDSVLRPDSPLEVQQTMLSQCTGKLGSCIVHKLEKLGEDLPDLWLQERAQTTVTRLCMVEHYPVALNHGDLIPSNILVEEETWKITGIVDWAEAEYLPFGICLYGLEHLLGFLQRSSQESGPPTFVYYDNAFQLRELFWTCLSDFVPGLGARQEEVRLMRDVGVLLWHGYAWDEGAIDRVVDKANDGEELAKLRAFLSVC